MTWLKWALAGALFVEGTGVGMGVIDWVLSPLWSLVHEQTRDVETQRIAPLWVVLEKLRQAQAQLGEAAPLYWPEWTDARRKKREADAAAFTSPGVGKTRERVSVPLDQERERRLAYPGGSLGFNESALHR